METKYHNPDLLIQLISLTNEVEVKVSGVMALALINLGPQVCTISHDFCQHLGLQVKPLEDMIHLEEMGALQFHTQVTLN